MGWTEAATDGPRHRHSHSARRFESEPRVARHHARIEHAEGIGSGVRPQRLLKALPLRHCLTVTRVLRRATARRPASRDETLRHRVAARLHSGRVACVETALATPLAAVAHGHHTHLVLGARFDPLELHAWTTTRGAIIGEQAELDRELHRVHTL
ncbi:lasso peptide biosynthesis B2 protein [Embleya sp. NPDC050154]|uniref:lasso peptide biosynthesis B2 protein n=1 Tax=Embleya sp. NPDC050154 TaxID=3363988 RepID=UPI0037A7961B